jgi:hypothetical protein
MAKSDYYTTQYRQMRNMWGLILAAVWIVWWWFSNSASEQAALSALPQADGIISGTALWWKKTNIQSAFVWEMFLAVLSSPLAFIVSHYAARWRVEQMQKAEIAHTEAEQGKQLAQQAADLDRIRKVSESEAEKAQRANERHELITRIGDVDSQLLVYETEQDQERKTRMLLNLTQFVYEVHAKFPGDKLTRILASDDVLRRMVENTLAHMRSLGLDSRNFYTVLNGILPAPAPVAGGTETTSSSVAAGAQL